MAESKHTPTPWRARGRTILSDGVVLADTFPTGAGPRGTTAAEANAAFIVRAVNAHDDLLAALKSARSNLDAIGDDFSDPRTLCASGRAIIDAALAKAAGDRPRLRQLPI